MNIVPLVSGAPTPEQKRCPSNQRKSTRFNFLTFLPITIFIQLKKVTNDFYLFNMVLQMIPAISTNSWLASGIPTFFVMFLGILKEFICEM